MANATTIHDHSAPKSGRPGPILRRELRRRLLALPYRAFLQANIHLLHAQGCASARPAGRDTWKGRNAAGGWDAEADLTAGSLGTLRCVAQAKQFDTLTVAQRHVDELRGAALRAAASQAILITLSSFSPPARRAAQVAGAVPVRLIDGEELLDLLIASRLGVRRDRDGEWSLDEDYFDALRRFAPPQKISSKGAAAANKVAGRNRSRLRALSVTVRLDPAEAGSRTGGWRWEPGTDGEPR